MIIKNFFKNLFRPLPKWAHGLECDICKMSFKSASKHYYHVKHNICLTKMLDHNGKIPKITKE